MREIKLEKDPDLWHFRAEEMKQEAIFWHGRAMKYKIISIVLFLALIIFIIFVR